MKIGGRFVRFFVLFVLCSIRSHGEDNVEVFCSENFIRIIATFDEPFYGRLATSGGERGCAVRGAGHRDVRMDIETNAPSRRRCKVTESEFDFSVQLEIQANAELLTAEDSAYVVRCPIHRPPRTTTTTTTINFFPLQPVDDEMMAAEHDSWPFSGDAGTFGPTEELDFLDATNVKFHTTTVKTINEFATTNMISTTPNSSPIPQERENSFKLFHRQATKPLMTTTPKSVNQLLNVSQIVQPIQEALQYSSLNTRIGRCVAYNGTFVLRRQTFDFVQLTDDNGCPLAAGLDPPARGSTIDASRAFAVESRSPHFFAHCTVHTCDGDCERVECAPGAGAPLFVVDGGADVATAQTAPTPLTTSTVAVHPDQVSNTIDTVERRGAHFARKFENAARDDDNDYSTEDGQWNVITISVVLCLASFMVVLLLVQYICIPKFDIPKKLLTTFRRKKSSSLLPSDGNDIGQPNSRTESEWPAPQISLDALPPPPSIPLSRLLQFAERGPTVEPIQQI